MRGHSASGQLRTDQVRTDTVTAILPNRRDPKAIRSGRNRYCGMVPGQPAPLPVTPDTNRPKD
jgi:hypothetical protein